MKTVSNERAESPIEVGLYVMVCIIVMALITLTFGSLIDQFVHTINTVDISLSSWGSDMMTMLPLRLAGWFFLIPGFFILLVMVWGVKTIIRKHRYSYQQDQYISSEEY